MAGHERVDARAAGAYKALALLLVLGAIGYAVSLLVTRMERRSDDARAAATTSAAGTRDGPGGDTTDTGGDTATSAGMAGAPDAGGGGATRAGSRPAPDDLASVVAPGQAPSMGEVITRLHDAGVHTGLGAFNPPGTSPPLVGLAVPDDYVLPPGYVRHFQATDDGQRIEPILMYSPDVVLFDAAGQRIPIPADRVVPPERAPAGLVLRPVTIPPPRDPRSPAT